MSNSTQPSDSETENHSTQQPLPVIARSDLMISQTGSGAFPLWTVKDPIAEKFYQLRQADFFVFSQLNGQTSIAEIQQRFFLNHAPQKLTAEQILNFVQSLFAQGLVQLNRYGSATILKGRADRQRASERKQKLTNLLSIRFRGIDPDQMLTRWLPWVQWFFSPYLMAASVILLVSATTLAFSEWEQIYRDFPGFETFLKSGHFLWFIAIVAGVKVLHEFAHAFACKQFGGECHELGVMLLAFTPCLYCNVSDAWLLKNRWHRIAISGAGMFLEIIIASLSTFVWYWTVPGVVHTISLYLMVISSVSTVFLNGNPLLRYDGYYILSDLLRIPNLRGRAQNLVRSWCMKFFFGMASPDPLRGQSASKILLGIYGICSGLYIWVIVFAILWMLYQAAEPYDLEMFVVGFAIVVLSTRAAGFGAGIVKTVVSVHQHGKLKVYRFGVATIIAVTLISGGLLIEFPRRIQAPCLIESGRSSLVFVSSPGQVEFVNLKQGATVNAGEVLAQLTNHDLEREVSKLEGQFAQQQQRVELLLLRQSQDSSAAAEIPSSRSTLLDYQEQLRNKQEDLKRLTLRAMQSGVILPVDNPQRELNQTLELQMVGSAIHSRNEGAWLPTGAKLCKVADTNILDAVLYLEQSEAVLLNTGAKVRLTISQSAGEYLEGVVLEIAAEPLQEVPLIIMRKELIPLQPDQHGRLRPARPIHEVRVRLEQNSQPITLGQSGTAAINLASETVLKKLLRQLRQTVTFEL